jgi:hypothetical protein
MTCHSSAQVRAGDLWLLFVDPRRREQLLIAVPDIVRHVTAVTSSGSARTVRITHNFALVDVSDVRRLLLDSGQHINVPHPDLSSHRSGSSSKSLDARR